jgi:hypothetical protein
LFLRERHSFASQRQFLAAAGCMSTDGGIIRHALFALQEPLFAGKRF